MRRVKAMPGYADILFGETPYGWRLSPDRSKLVVAPEEQRLLAVVRHMYLVERIPMREIVERLEAMHVVNRRGRPFGLTGVWEIIHRRHETPPEASRSRKPSRARSERRA